MKLPLNNTTKYTKLPKDIEDTINIISNKVGEVESYRDLSKKYTDIVIAQIKEKEEHPNADKLAIYKITTGQDDIQVLAGDKTLEIGDKVAYIKPGGVIPSTYDNEPVKIKSVAMRGKKSNGMMCSEKELDIGPDHEKVLRLPSDAPVGENFAKYYKLDDTIVDIENKALTNRGDLFGILGLSRELAGAQGIKFESPDWYHKFQIALEPSEVCLNLDIDNQAKTLCPRYCAIAMTDVKIQESPIWLKSILLKSGIKPVNNIVDITNYLMIVTGQPLHAFDYDKVVKTDTEQADMAHIVIRTAKPEESIHALDGNIYELHDRHLVIANSQHPIAIAGVVGGQDTEIDENSRNIILESANFDRYSLRKTSMNLGIVTEASTRFTRSQSPEYCDLIIAKAVELITEIADGKLASTLIDSYSNPRDKQIVTLNTERLQKKLGINISQKEISHILENIEYEIVKSENNYLTVKVPAFRQDIEIEEDIYEDIIRIYGYDKLKPKLPTRAIKSSTKSKMITLKDNIRNILSNSGCNELISYSFTNQKLLKLVNQDIDWCYKLKNPLSKDLELMRPSIIQSLLEKARLNTEQGIPTFAIYEMGISHQKDSLDDEKLPLEEWKLALLLSDGSNSIDGNPYYQAKRYLEKILNGINVENIEYTLLPDCDFENLPKWVKVVADSFEPNSTSIVTVKVGKSKKIVGILGEIGLTVKKNLSLNDFTAGFEINLEDLLLLDNNRKRQLEESRFPYITQDICFVVPQRITYMELFNKVNSTVSRENLRSKIECIDIYSKEDSTDRNITLRISVSDIKKTLTDKDYQHIRENIEKALKKLNINILQ
jgi:phenylalanyl-tRNA synthetase beta chain